MSHCACFICPLFHQFLQPNVRDILEERRDTVLICAVKGAKSCIFCYYTKKQSRENHPKSIFTSQHCILNTGNVLVISKCGPCACFIPSLRQCLWTECWIIDETRSWIKQKVCLCLCLSVCTGFSLCAFGCVCSCVFVIVFLCVCVDDSP